MSQDANESRSAKAVPTKLGKEAARIGLSRRAFTKASTFLFLHSPRMMASLLRPLPGSRRGEFMLRIPTGNPFFAWPRTLVSYPIASPAAATGSVLQCVETGESLPFQVANLSEPREAAAILFMADLPAGVTRTYRLLAGSPTPSKTAVNITTEPSRITIDTGSIRVRIPATQTVAGDAPGPILQLARAAGPSRWIGSSRLTIKDDPITSITTEQLETGASPFHSPHYLSHTLRSSLHRHHSMRRGHGLRPPP